MSRATAKTREPPLALASRAVGPRRVLPPSFYLGSDPVPLARALLGKVLCARVEGALSSVIVVETEAYRGEHDRACHAHGGRRTRRTEVMYRRGGVAYVFKCYGMHHLLNVVTDVEEQADAVLLRAGEPLDGVEHMRRRRGAARSDAELARGPGSLCKALGVTATHQGASFQGPELWLEDRGVVIADAEVVAGPRVGVDYAGADAALPWRFSVRGSPYVSRG